MLKGGGVGVLPTDTLYGLVALAGNKKVVERVYTIRKRSPNKPCVILISSIGDLSYFSIAPSAKMSAILDHVWPGPVSVILPCAKKKFAYLHRGTKTLAFRLPKSAAVRSLVSKTGPLIAPSANPEGKSPAKTISAAKKYFGTSVDFFVDCGRKESAPSSVIGVQNGVVSMHRRGAGAARFIIQEGV